MHTPRQFSCCHHSSKVRTIWSVPTRNVFRTIRADLRHPSQTLPHPVDWTTRPQCDRPQSPHRGLSRLGPTFSNIREQTYSPQIRSERLCHFSTCSPTLLPEPIPNQVAATDRNPIPTVDHQRHSQWPSVPNPTGRPHTRAALQLLLLLMTRPERAAFGTRPVPEQTHDRDAPIDRTATSDPTSRLLRRP